MGNFPAFYEYNRDEPKWGRAKIYFILFPKHAEQIQNDLSFWFDRNNSRPDSW